MIRRVILIVVGVIARFQRQVAHNTGRHCTSICPRFGDRARLQRRRRASVEDPRARSQLAAGWAVTCSRQILATALRPVFTTLNGNEICALSVRPADAPVYLRDGAKPRLYVRTGNATTPLPLDDAVQYIGTRWPGRTTGHLLDALLGRHT